MDYILFEAAYDNDASRIRAAIIDKGFDPNMTHPQAGHTPLQAACEADAINAIVTLLELGANPKLKFTKVSMVDGHIIGSNVTAMVYLESVAAAELLIQAGANVNEVDGHGYTPLVWAATDRKLELFNYLLEKGGDPHVKVPLADKQGTILDLIAEKIEFTKNLLGVKLNEKQAQYIADLEAIRERLVELGVQQSSS